MSDAENIKMTVVINPLISPLLSDALSGCRSARERATLLKALAERALRQQLTGRIEAVSTIEPTSGHPEVVAAPKAELVEGLQLLKISDSAGDASAFPGGSLGNEVASFFD